jgi:hypothetical protein
MIYFDQTPIDGKYIWQSHLGFNVIVINKDHKKGTWYNCESKKTMLVSSGMYIYTEKSDFRYNLKGLKNEDSSIQG